MPKPTTKAPISIDSINSNVINSEYAVRGEIVGVRLLEQAVVLWCAK